MHALRVHGRGTDGELEAFFATKLIGESRAERFARGVRLFWDHEFDDAAHIVVPRIEGVLRDVARFAGIAVTQPPKEGEFTGWLTLGQLLTKLRAHDPDLAWFDYLDGLLCEPLGPNLRNDIAHGIAPRVGPIAAAQLIQVACFLTHIRTPEDESELGG